MSKIKCNCPCHKDPNFKHVQACCVNGYVEMPDFTPSPKDQPEGQKTLRWVRASERNPTTEGLYHCNVEINHFGEWVKGKSAIGFYNGKWLRGEVYRVISWLEEIEETQQMASEAGMSQEDFERQTKYRPFTGEEIGTIGYNSESGDLRIEPYGDEVPPTEKALAAQGEIPEEIEKWIEEEGGNEDFAIYWRNGAIACYHKMQEEIMKAEVIINAALSDRDWFARLREVYANEADDCRKELSALQSQLSFYQQEIAEYRKAIENLNAEIDAYWNGDKSDGQVNKINSAQQVCFHLLKIKYPQLLT